MHGKWEQHTSLNPFRSSLSAKITNINIVLAMNSEKNWLALVRKLCGYVQNIPAVAVAEGGTVRMPCPVIFVSSFITWIMFRGYRPSYASMPFM